MEVPDEVRAIAFQPNTTTWAAVVGDNFGSSILFGTVSGNLSVPRIQQQIKIDGCATCFGFSPDGKSLLVGLQDTTVLNLSQR